LSGYIFIWILLTSIASAWLAHEKGRNPSFWFVMGLLFTLFSVLTLLFLPDLKAKNRKSEPTNSGSDWSDADKTIEIQLLNEKPDRISSALESVNSWYYLDTSRTPQGPFSFTSFKALWKEKKLNPDTFIWNEELKSWTRAKNLNGFWSRIQS
jgi:hypothetical protein